MNKGRIDYLDSVRGLAALIVFFSHFLSFYGDFGLPAWKALVPLDAFRDGFAAVTMFFVLSGFVLSRKYLDLDRASFSLHEIWRPFYVARLARIWLPFAAVLLVSAALKHLVFSPLSADLIPKPDGWILDLWRIPDTLDSLLRQLFLFRPTVGDHERLLPQDWTLTVELNLSLWMPFLILIARESAGTLVVFCLVSIGLMRVHGFVLDFAFGMILALYFETVQKFLRTHGAGFRTLILGTGLALFSSRVSQNLLPLELRLSERLVWYVMGVGSLLILAAIIGSVRLQRLLRARPLLFLGKVSYSFYLVHFAVLLCFTPAFIGMINRMGVVSVRPAHALCLMASLAVTLGTAWLGYVAVELPSIQLGKWLSRRLTA